jgi:hypothetical protein
MEGTPSTCSAEIEAAILAITQAKNNGKWYLISS